MGLRDLVIDAWSWLNYKPVMANPIRRGFGPFGELAAGWVPPEDLRRLQAYKLLAAYDNNQAGQLAAIAGDETGLERRELGDASKLIDTALGYMLGSEQTIVVPGAEHQGSQDQPPGAAQALAVQGRLREWGEKELLPLRIQQCERAAVRCGDAVYTLAWEPAKGRPALRTIDAGFYFPEWTDDEADAAEYPARVHFAWELPADEQRGLKARLRRITYELGPIGPATKPSLSKDGRPLREWAYSDAGEAVLILGDQLDVGTGRITRVYPWAVGRPSGITCYLTDAEWLLEDLKGEDVYNLPPAKATYRMRSDGEVLQALDLMIDFVPVVHVTNTIPDAGEHWGQPSIAKVMQVLDELAATDSDSAAASATTGTPIIGLSGIRLPKDRTTGATLPLQVRAGTVWSLSEGGSMDTLDTSAQLAELRARVDHLLDRVAGNSRLTSSGLGTLDPSAVPSGYALQLALGPLDALVSAMRLARAHKYALLFKMVCRLYQAGQAEGWTAGETLAVKLTWGPHTPTDRAAVLDEVTKGFQAGVLSLETSVRMLADAGYPIEDATQEVKRIQARAFVAAVALADATADNDAVREYLGLPKASPEIPKVPMPTPAKPPMPSPANPPVPTPASW